VPWNHRHHGPAPKENPPSKRCQFVHKWNCIDRDLKLENFVMGVGPSANELYIIDFGLAK
jgi:hypothetical protein